MRVTVNTDDLLKQVESLKQELERKLTGMVSIFIYQIGFNAVENTPFGDFEKFEGLYRLRQSNIGRMMYGLTPQPGHAKGGWVIEYNKPFSANRIGVVADGPEAGNVKKELDFKSDQYKLGDTVFIQNNVPYMYMDGFITPWNKALEKGSSPNAPNGIMKPTTDIVMDIYRTDLKRYFEGS